MTGVLAGGGRALTLKSYPVSAHTRSFFVSIASLPTWVAPDVVVDGRFAIKRVLAAGGTAVVVAAEHLRLRQLVALKFLRPEYASNQSLTARFLREARAAASLRNEHVVNVTDVGVLPDGAPYLVMEYLDGKSLAQCLKEAGSLPVPQVVEYTLQALEALAEAHGAGIVHRDLKPDNLVLLNRLEEPPLLKVIDFGISKLTGPEVTQADLTKNNSFMGSPLYASPEQIRDSSQVDARSDIWSIGVVMYELLTGHPPFRTRTTAGLIWEICADEPTPLVGLASAIPEQLFAIVSRCLQKNPDHRFANIQDLARAFYPLAHTPACQFSIERIVRRRSSVPPISRPPASTPPVWKSVKPATVRARPAWPSKGQIGLVLSAAFGITIVTLFALPRMSLREGAAEPLPVPRAAAAVMAATPREPSVAREPQRLARALRREPAVVSPAPPPVRTPPVSGALPPASAKSLAAPPVSASVAKFPPPAELRARAATPRSPRALDHENPFTR